jgi:hypothetical protein
MIENIGWQTTRALIQLSLTSGQRVKSLLQESLAQGQS